MRFNTFRYCTVEFASPHFLLYIMYQVCCQFLATLPVWHGGISPIADILAQQQRKIIQL